MTFGAQVDEREAADIVRTCLEANITQFDTANSYQDGEAERLLGKILRNLDRDRYCIATKVGNPKASLGDEAGLSPRAISRAIDASLRRLGVDYVDVYFMHMPDPEVPLEASLEAFADIVAAGKARFVGVSNFAAWQIVQMSRLASLHSWPRPVWGQQMYNLLARRVEDEYLPAAAALGMKSMVYNPLAGGLLTGKYLEPNGVGRRFERPEYRHRYWNPTNHNAVLRLRDFANRHGMRLTELALRWLRTRSGVDSIVLGVSSLAQLKENLMALESSDLPVDAEDFCDRIWVDLRGVAPHYHR